MNLENQLYHKQSGTWKWGLLCLAFLAPFFFLSYGFSNQYASTLTDVPSIVFAWESYIPLWPWTIIPYWSIDLFYGLALLLCWNKFELRQLVLRLLSAQIIAVIFFLLFPLKFSFNRPELDGFFGLWFDVLMGFDQPYNQAPSLHIILLLILWDFYRRHVRKHWKFIVDFWSILIVISVLTTWQHHFIDIPAGLLIGAFCLWLFPLKVLSPIRPDPLSFFTKSHFKMAILYLLAAFSVFIIALYLNSWALWLLYPAISLSMVGLAYLFNRAHFFQKQSNGQITCASWIIFAPYLLFAWLNSRMWTFKHPQDSKVITLQNQSIYLGRAPSARNQKNYQGLFDCCAEISTSLIQQHQQYLSLDLIPLNPQQLCCAAEKLHALFLQQSTLQHQSILIFCALGYSRSSAILAAWMIQQEHAANVGDAVEAIQHARPWIILNPTQLDQLELYHTQLKGSTV